MGGRGDGFDRAFFYCSCFVRGVALHLHLHGLAFACLILREYDYMACHEVVSL
jgi:hypothetical protein